MKNKNYFDIIVLILSISLTTIVFVLFDTSEVIYEYTEKYEDFELTNYDPHPHIKAAVSV